MVIKKWLGLFNCIVGLGFSWYMCFMIHTGHVFAAVFLCFIPRYWMLDVSKVHASSGSNAWDSAVHNASEEYKQRMVICVSSLFRIKSVEIHIVQLWTTVRKSKTVNVPSQLYVDILCNGLLQGGKHLFEHPFRKSAVYILTFISAFPPAQPLLWQLSLTCCHGTELDAVWQQHLVEYGESLPTVTHSWKTRQVRLIEHIHTVAFKYMFVDMRQSFVWFVQLYK